MKQLQHKLFKRAKHTDSILCNTLFDLECIYAIISCCNSSLDN